MRFGDALRMRRGKGRQEPALHRRLGDVRQPVAAYLGSAIGPDLRIHHLRCRRDQHEAIDQFRIFGGEGLGRHATDRGTDDMSGGDTEGAEE